MDTAAVTRLQQEITTLENTLSEKKRQLEQTQTAASRYTQPPKFPVILKDEDSHQKSTTTRPQRQKSPRPLGRGMLIALDFAMLEISGQVFVVPDCPTAPLPDCFFHCPIPLPVPGEHLLIRRRNT